MVVGVDFSRDAYGPSVLLAAKRCSAPGKAASSLSARLGSHVRGKRSAAVSL